MMIKYRTLIEDEFDVVYGTMDEAFSDYLVKMEMTPKFYRSKLDLEGVKFEHSVGVFEDDRMVGATMNAVGFWKGKSTVYDSGTGVIPEFRRKGLSTGMFEFIIPLLQKQGFHQYLLEVITGNAPAKRLYEGLGFKVGREFAIYKQNETQESASLRSDIEITDLVNPDWGKLRSFWEISPAWQNSVDSVKRAIKYKMPTVFLGVFLKNELVGYGVVFRESNKLVQIAINEKYRRNGYGKVLLSELQKRVEKPLIVTNVDTNASGVLGFLEANGFYKTISQYEMLLEL